HLVYVLGYGREDSPLGSRTYYQQGTRVGDKWGWSEPEMIEGESSVLSRIIVAGSTVHLLLGRHLQHWIRSKNSFHHVDDLVAADSEAAESFDALAVGDTFLVTCWQTRLTDSREGARRRGSSLHVIRCAPNSKPVNTTILESPVSALGAPAPRLAFNGNVLQLLGAAVSVPREWSEVAGHSVPVNGL